MFGVVAQRQVTNQKWMLFPQLPGERRMRGIMRGARRFDVSGAEFCFSEQIERETRFDWRCLPLLLQGAQGAKRCERLGVLPSSEQELRTQALRTQHVK